MSLLSQPTHSCLGPLFYIYTPAPSSPKPWSCMYIRIYPYVNTCCCRKLYVIIPSIYLLGGGVLRRARANTLLLLLLLLLPVP